MSGGAPVSTEAMSARAVELEGRQRHLPILLPEGDRYACWCGNEYTSDKWAAKHWGWVRMANGKDVELPESL